MIETTATILTDDILLASRTTEETALAHGTGKFNIQDHFVPGPGWERDTIATEAGPDLHQGLDTPAGEDTSRWMTDDLQWQWMKEDLQWTTEDLQWTIDNLQWMIEDHLWMTEELQLKIADHQLKTEDLQWKIVDLQWKIVDLQWKIVDLQWMIVDPLWITTTREDLTFPVEATCPEVRTNTTGETTNTMTSLAVETHLPPGEWAVEEALVHPRTGMKGSEEAPRCAPMETDQTSATMSGSKSSCARELVSPASRKATFSGTALKTRPVAAPLSDTEVINSINLKI